MTGRRNIQPDETFVYREVGQRIRKARQQRGMSQAELAELVFLSRVSITNIEAGRQSITLAGFLSFADALDTEWAGLLGNKTDGAPTMQELADTARYNMDEP